MWKLFLTALVSLAAVAVVPLAAAQSAGSADVLTATVTVDAIDKAQRMVTVRDERGRKDTFHAPAEMQRFDELKVGDRINMTYYQGVAFEVRKRDAAAPATVEAPAEKPVGTSGTTEITRGAGPLPSGAITQRRTATVTVKATDLPNQLLTVWLPSGRVATHKVQDPEMLKGIVADDKIDITYAEGLLIEVERP
jgi:hypothetical protein